ncbi:MAG TPA: hypothetical protein VH207_06115 [Chthoniobacterales bacterium]|jgi:hypothetical protein|nr:hypothetical protein [Chthoniobacterales bacterium]
MKRHFNPDEKLAVLQEADTFRKWYSLDDLRACVLCDRVISGRMISVRRSRDGSYHLHCPTPGCRAKPRDWFYHGATRPAATRVFQSEAPVIGFGLSAI